MTEQIRAATPFLTTDYRMELHTIHTGLFKLDGGAMFGVVPKALWQKHIPADANNLCTWAMRSLLVEHENRLLLIDTGIGAKQSDKFFSHYHLHGDMSLKSELAKRGFGLEDITDVLLTHLHFDHVGGAVERRSDGVLEPTFPNAQYWSCERHWQWAMNSNPREKASFLSENLLPLETSGQLVFVPREDRWNRIEVQIRRDAVRVLRRLEKAVEPPPRAGARKKATRKKATPRKTSPKKPAAS